MNVQITFYRTYNFNIKNLNNFLKLGSQDYSFIGCGCAN